MLALPDFIQPFQIESDASRKGVRAILMQGGGQIAYFSKALAGSNLSESAYEKELMTLVLADIGGIILWAEAVVFADQKMFLLVVIKNVGCPNYLVTLK